MRDRETATASCGFRFRCDLAAGVDKSFLEFRHRQGDGGGACGQQDVASRGDELLIISKDLSQSTFRAIAEDSVSDGCGRGDDAESGKRCRS